MTICVLLVIKTNMYMTVRNDMR